MNIVKMGDLVLMAFVLVSSDFGVIDVANQVNVNRIQHHNSRLELSLDTLLLYLLFLRELNTQVPFFVQMTETLVPRLEEKI